MGAASTMPHEPRRRHSSASAAPAAWAVSPTSAARSRHTPHRSSSAHPSGSSSAFGVEGVTWRTSTVAECAPPPRPTAPIARAASTASRVTTHRPPRHSSIRYDRHWLRGYHRPNQGGIFFWRSANPTNLGVFFPPPQGAASSSAATTNAVDGTIGLASARLTRGLCFAPLASARAEWNIKRPKCRWNIAADLKTPI